MNFKRFMITVFAATMTLGLSACPSNNDANCSKEGTITISKNKEIFTVGQRVDLDEYINVTGLCGEKKYTASLAIGSEAVAQIRDHTLILLDEGDFKVRITAGPQDSQKAVNFIGTAYSELRMKFYQATKDLYDRYAFLGIETDSEGNQKVTEQIFHNTNYYFECRETKNGTKGMGYLKYPISKRAYAFECNDFNGDTYSLSGRDFDFDNRTIMTPWKLDINKILSQVDANAQDYLEIPSEEKPNNPNYFNNYAEEFAYNAMGVYMDPESNYEVSSINIYCDSINEKDVFYFDVLISKSGSNPELYGRYKFVPAAEASCGWIETILKGEEPELVDTQPLLDKVDSLNQASNYTITLNQWWEDEEGNTVNLAEHEVPRVRSIYSHVPNATETALVDVENKKCLSTVTGTKFDGAVRGYCVHNENTYFIDNNPENPEDPYTVVPTAYEKKGISIDDVVAKYSLQAFSTEDGSDLSNFDALKYEESGNLAYMDFRGAGKNGNVIFNAIGMFQTLGYCYNHLWSTMIRTNSYQFFNASFCFGADTFIMSGSLKHDFDDISFIYNFEITVSDVNLTVVDLSGINYIAEVNE